MAQGVEGTIRRWLAPLVVVAAASSVPTVGNTAVMVFFGEDLGAASSAGATQSKAARDAFLNHLAGLGLTVGIEDFESFSGGDAFFTNPGLALEFAGTGVTGDLTGGIVRDAPRNARFAISGTDYLDTSFNQRITFSTPVAAFGLFVTDANEIDNDPAQVTQGNGAPLSDSDIAERPFESVDGIFRLVTERSPGVFEALGGAQATFPAADSSALFLGVVDTANPFANVILINGTSGLDSDFLDGFGYDDLLIATPVPAALPLLASALGLLGVGWARRRRPRRRG